MTRVTQGSVRYIAFGAMAVAVDGTVSPLTRGRERGVLAVLLTAHGAPVPAERLVAEVWGDDVPGQTLAALQVAVSRLRSQLEPGRAARTGSRLVSTAAGYALVADTADVDTWRFESLAEQALAAEAPGDRLRLADEARALWTSTPYADCDAPVVLSETSRLQELLLTVEEARGRSLLDLGRPDEALRGLAETAPRNPYRERMWALLALAQYQCSRQADALETLRRLRDALADELGVDPSEEIQRLEQAVLRQDPALNAPTPPAAPRLSEGGPSDGPLSVSARVEAGERSGTVGRDEVLRRALGLVEDAAASGKVRFLLVAGEPGIGKSRLVADMGAESSEHGFRVLVGRCQEADFAPPLWPWLSVVRELSSGQDHDPLLVPLLEGEVGDASAGAGTGLRMFDAVVELLSRAAATSPLLVVLEDIHWADATSLGLLRHLASSAATRAMSVAVLCTRRTTEAETGDSLVDILAVLARAGAERVRLDGLDTGSVGALLTAAIGAHDARLDEFVGEVTGGNPFFVLQYARQLASLPDLGHVEPATLPVPDGIRDVLRQRIRRLPEPVVRTLTAAAVLGRSIDPDVVAELAGVPVDDCLDHLDLAMASGLVDDQGAGYVFVHALARESLYAELSAARRMRLHDRAGRVVEAHRGSEVDAAADIAHHTHLAAPLGPEHAARACSWLARAAAVAEARCAHAEALAIWRQVEDDAPTDSDTRIEAKCGAAAALLRMARTVEGRLEVEEAVQVARRVGRWDLVARAAAIYNGAGVWSWREHGERDHEFIEVLTEAARHVAAPQRARVLAALQMEYFYGWDSTVADPVGAESVELARASGDQQLLIEVLLVRILATWGPSRAPTRLELIDEVLSYEPTGELRVFILFQLATALYDVFEPQRADEVMRQCADEAAALRHTGVEIPLAWWRAARGRDLDDPAAAELGDVAFTLHRTSGYIAGAELQCLAAIRGSAPGTPVPDDVVEVARTANPGLRAMVAHAALEAGDPDTAYSLLGEPAPPGAMEYSVLAGHCLRVLVLAETGSAEEVRAALARIAPYAGQTVAYGTVDHLGVVDHFLACGYAALGDPRAVEHARVAVELNERLQCRPWLRRAEALLAQLS
jgi:DNA-binding SARP family transcriptional activator